MEAKFKMILFTFVVQKKVVMGLFFFKIPSHRVFNYQPIYYDERKEAMRERIENAEKRAKGEYVQGDTIRKGFKNLRDGAKRSRGAKKSTRFVSMVAIVIIVIALFYFADAISLLFTN